ncbi:ATP-binding protein [Pseudoclavibacter sp. AY1H1]|uniref:ATP-binding protein n=1 Tax=Pseudoclavibacter sp. AY1H1 TaxID=2080584 RepID=UPI000CE7B4F3|nr:ATP-binding protein [Pseudoclavibacter sp. AY1H1]PPF38516.1 ATP-binding protein [Pseudoclavibacter sp. AY1H1]
MTELEIVGASAGTDSEGYELRISRLTIDKLGVKLYDRVSAVVAELVANSYDADATNVRVKLPLKTLLSVQDQELPDWIVSVGDDGHGLTPAEARAYYLLVGADRRKTGAGALSRKFKRPVMGRKGIGKLAPFGICKRIEVISAGGPETADGYLTSHFLMDFDSIVEEDNDQPVPLPPGHLDNTYLPTSGTQVILSGFLPKRVPDGDVFMRQLERRFALADPEFAVTVEDIRQPGDDPLSMKTFQIDVVESTRIDLTQRPVSLENGSNLSVTGWVAMATESYRNEEMAGVRIYARGKIVATTRDFEQRAGFTGEFATRSYMVGEVHADWLDDDDDDDLVRTDRQSILWESDKGTALRNWGAEIVREIGRLGREPRREKVKKLFRQVADLERRARARFKDESVVKVALSLGDSIGGFAAEDELLDADYVEGLAQVILTVAPHQALVTAFQDFERTRTGGAEPSLEELLDLFGKTRVAEAASYAQIASERVQVLDQLDSIVFDTARDEAALQRIITEAPWLIQPDWTVITANQSLKTFKVAFENYLKREHKLDTTLAIEYESKRPDFTLVAVGGMLHVVEIKASGHALDDSDFERLFRYVDALRKFFEKNTDMAAEFPRKWRIDLVVDSVALKDPMKEQAYATVLATNEVFQLSWDDFRNRARRTNEAFLQARDDAAGAARGIGVRNRS